MSDRIERLTAQDLTQLSAAEFDAMPFGMIRLNRQGVIKAYNQWEAALARRSVHEVIGKNFFTDVAPCTNVAEFRGKLEELFQSPTKTHIFDYNFAFPWGVRRVRVRFVVESADECWVLVTNVDKAKPNLPASAA